MEIKPIARDVNGLIVGVNYIQDGEGLIDWRKMVAPEFLVPNRRLFEKNQQPVPDTIEGLQDNELLILLAGIKRLAKLRGYNKVEYPVVVAPNSEFVSAICRIEWLPNFETEGRVMVHSAGADAHPGNTDGFGTLYLTAIAQNRSFVRAVREFLNINIVGQDEVNDKPLEETPFVPAQTSAASLLEKLMAAKGVTFESVKDKLMNDKQLQTDGAENFTSINDIPKVRIFDLIERLKRKKA